MKFDSKAVLDRIDAGDLVKAALDPGNIDSPTGSEGPVADYVHDWLRREGFEARKAGAHRPDHAAPLEGKARA